MTRPTSHSFACSCGKTITHQQYEYVNVAENPQLRYIVLAGLLNSTKCPNCGRQTEFPTPFIYSDPAYAVLAYVHPSTDVPEEARALILEKLRLTYKEIADQQREPQNRQNTSASNGRQTASTQENALPPLRVIFGLEQFADLMSTILSSEDRLGKLALNTQSRDEAERGQFLDITRKLATEMGCIIDVEDLPDEYTVWLYGSRRQISALMQALAPRG